MPHAYCWWRWRPYGFGIDIRKLTHMDLKYLVKALSEHKLLYSEQERAAEVVKDLVVEIERLTAENEAIRKDRDDLLQQALGVEAERDIARMENERLRGALRPFADGYSGALASFDEREGQEQYCHGFAVFEDFERAHAAYQQQTTKP